MNKGIKPLLVCGLLICGAVYNKVSAQVNPLGAQYFHNQYLGNPAMAALDSGFTINLGYRQQMDNIQGAPKRQAITGTYRLGQLGLGVNVNNEQSGLLKQTRAVATLAYHLPVGGDDEQLHLGFSVGALNEHFDTKNLVGDVDDPMIGQMNNNKIHFDGDVGLAYSGKGFTIQATLPQFRTAFSKTLDKSVNRATFFTAVSYKQLFGEGESVIGFEPKLCYRGVKGYKNVMDAGAEISFMDNLFAIQGMYHSTKNFTGGITANYKSLGSLLVLYNSQPPVMSDYTKANLELGLRINL